MIGLTRKGIGSLEVEERQRRPFFMNRIYVPLRSMEVRLVPPLIPIANCNQFPNVASASSPSLSRHRIWFSTNPFTKDPDCSINRSTSGGRRFSAPMNSVLIVVQSCPSCESSRHDFETCTLSSEVSKNRVRRGTYSTNLDELLPTSCFPSPSIVFPLLRNLLPLRPRKIQLFPEYWD